MEFCKSSIYDRVFGNVCRMLFLMFPLKPNLHSSHLTFNIFLDSSVPAMAYTIASDSENEGHCTKSGQFARDVCKIAAELPQSGCPDERSTTQYVEMKGCNTLFKLFKNYPY